MEEQAQGDIQLGAQVEGQQGQNFMVTIPGKIDPGRTSDRKVTVAATPHQEGGEEWLNAKREVAPIDKERKGEMKVEGERVLDDLQKGPPKGREEGIPGQSLGETEGRDAKGPTTLGEARQTKEETMPGVPTIKEEEAKVPVTQEEIKRTLDEADKFEWADTNASFVQNYMDEMGGMPCLRTNALDETEGMSVNVLTMPITQYNIGRTPDRTTSLGKTEGTPNQTETLVWAEELSNKRGGKSTPNDKQLAMCQFFESVDPKEEEEKELRCVGILGPVLIWEGGGNTVPHYDLEDKEDEKRQQRKRPMEWGEGGASIGRTKKKAKRGR
jgi:hypothetical protein